MSLNEAYNGKVNTSTVDMKRTEKALANLTEAARKELDRMDMIFENSMTIGKNNTGCPEAPKTTNFNEKLGEPFNETAKAELDKDLKATASEPKKQGTPFEEDGEATDKDMQSTEMPKGGDADKDFKKAEYVPDGAVAEKKPAGGKVVKVNESCVNEDEDIIGLDDEEGFDQVDDTMGDDDINALINDEDYFDEMGEDEPVFDDVDLEPQDEMEMYDGEYEEEPMEFPMESKKSLNNIVESVCDDLIKQNRKKRQMHECVKKMIDKIVKEEVTKLDVFGKHPGYRKSPMTTPVNKEVIVAKGDHDWNDESAKGEEGFGKKIGSSAPFDEKTINVLADAVMKVVKLCDTSSVPSLQHSFLQK